MPHFEVGLGTNSCHVCLADLMPVVAALDVQAREHVGPIWNLTARVSLLEDPGNVPVGMSPILVTDEMPGQIHGVHVMDQDVAFAMVLAAEGWELAASHECIEMLIDPSGGTKKPGRRLAITDGILGDADGLVEYIVEACDPVEDASYAYQIGGVWVSDFYTPQYFDDVKRDGVRYTYRDQLDGPRTVGRNGYLSWHDPDANALRQLRNFDRLEIIPLDPHARATTDEIMPTLRCHVDRLTETPRVLGSRQRTLSRRK